MFSLISYIGRRFRFQIWISPAQTGVGKLKRVKVSNNVIRRLPRYLQKLDELGESGVDRISSGELGRANSRSPTMHQGWMMYIRREKTRRCLRSAGTSDVRNANRNKLVGSRAKYMLSNRESQEYRRSAASAKRAQKDRRNPTMLVP